MSKAAMKKRTVAKTEQNDLEREKIKETIRELEINRARLKSELVRAHNRRQVVVQSRRPRGSASERRGKDMRLPL